MRLFITILLSLLYYGVFSYKLSQNIDVVSHFNLTPNRLSTSARSNGVVKNVRATAKDDTTNEENIDVCLRKCYKKKDNNQTSTITPELPETLLIKSGRSVTFKKEESRSESGDFDIESLAGPLAPAGPDTDLAEEAPDQSSARAPLPTFAPAPAPGQGSAPSRTTPPAKGHGGRGLKSSLLHLEGKWFCTNHTLRTLMTRVIQEFPHDYSKIATQLYKQMVKTSHGAWVTHVMPAHTHAVTFGPAPYFRRSHNSCIFTNKEYMVHALKVI